MTRFVYLGTYTQTDPSESHREEGIFVYWMDPVTGRMVFSSTAPGLNPSFLAFHPKKRVLYAVNELIEGMVSAYAIHPQTGALTFLNAKPTQGAHPCYVSVDDRGEWVMCANYTGGSISLHPVLPDGSLGELSDWVQHQGVLGPNQDRQESPHAHSIDFDPSRNFLLVADLGLDKVILYRLDRNRGKFLNHGEITLPPGSGPRHFTFTRDGRHLFVANELGNTVSVFRWDAEKGSAERIETVSTLPPDFSQENIVADIHLSQDESYLYVSNRGHDSLAIFKVQKGEKVHLSPVAHSSVEGSWPRNFGIDPTGRFILVANQYSNRVVLFHRHPETGRVEPAGISLDVPSPVCVKFYDL